MSASELISDDVNWWVAGLLAVVVFGAAVALRWWGERPGRLVVRGAGLVALPSGRPVVDAVTVVFTFAEAERLYASASFYEARVDRVLGVGDAQVELADRALTKLAQAMHPGHAATPLRRETDG